MGRKPLLKDNVMGKSSSMYGETRNWSENLRCKRQLKTPRCRWENNIRMDLMEIGWEDVDWMHLGHSKGTVAGCCEHGNEPLGFMKGMEFPD